MHFTPFLPSAPTEAENHWVKHKAKHNVLLILNKILPYNGFIAFPFLRVNRRTWIYIRNSRSPIKDFSKAQPLLFTVILLENRKLNCSYFIDSSLPFRALSRWWRHIFFVMYSVLVLAVTCSPSLQRTVWCVVLLKILKPIWPNPLNSKDYLSMKTNCLINRETMRHCCSIAHMYSCAQVDMNEGRNLLVFLLVTEEKSPCLFCLPELVFSPWFNEWN